LAAVANKRKTPQSQSNKHKKPGINKDSRPQHLFTPA
jgi:hypothetical protein